MPKVKVAKEIQENNKKPKFVQSPITERALKLLSISITKPHVREEIVKYLYEKSNEDENTFKNELLLLQNDLKKNKSLKEKVEDEIISPKELVDMDKSKRMDPKLSEMIQLVEKNEKEKNKGIDPDSFPDSLDLVCGKCRTKKVYETQVQLRSADEPMTRICQCLRCGNRWKQSC